MDRLVARRARSSAELHRLGAENEELRREIRVLRASRSALLEYMERLNSAIVDLADEMEPE
jgi:predicted nuclease with TOPRIM domain